MMSNKFVVLSEENISRKVALLMVELYLCTHQVIYLKLMFLQVSVYIL